MPTTFVKIQSITVGSGGSSTMEFTNIPQNYSDLKIVASIRATTSVDNLIKFNGLTTNLASTYAYSAGTSGASATDASNIQLQGGIENAMVANTFGHLEIYIPNYTSANTKAVYSNAISPTNVSASYSLFQTGRWADSSAITTILLVPGSGSYMQYTSAYLYGIKSS
jgi:hypothetical protein